MVSTKPPSGFRDFFNESASRRLRLTKIISDVYESFGFNPLITPAMENLEVLIGSGGGQENEKLIFKVMKRGEKLQSAIDSKAEENKLADFGMRFDLTVPLSRTVAQYQNDIAFPWKVFQVGSVWRAERPQKGRFREFTQCDVDIVGAVGLGGELEVIQAVASAVGAVGATNFNLHINDRRLLQSFAESFGFGADKVDAFAIILDKKDKLPREKVLEELKALAGGKLSTEVEQIVDEKFSLDHAMKLNEGAAKSVQYLMTELNKLNLPLSEIIFDPSLARGMGYYTGTIYELRHKSAGYSLGGGGRYDKLIGRFSKQTHPAVGFSIGFDRLLLLLEEKEGGTESKGLFIPIFHENLRGKVLELANSIRKEGVSVDVYPDAAKMKAQFKFAEKAGYQWVLVAGEDEFDSQEFKLKDFKSGKESSVKKSELHSHLKNCF
jgi:histidyl-tRNA synthetase